jgi:hypothetical protein
MCIFTPAECMPRSPGSRWPVSPPGVLRVVADRLCHSRNKPFCSGMHNYVKFHDSQPEPDHEPTLFEWCGGLSGADPDDPVVL